MGMSPRELRIDLSVMPAGGRYEDRYGKYLETFQQIAEYDGRVIVKNPPASWVPLLWYLGVFIHGQIRLYFAHDELVQGALNTTPMLDLDRTAVEVLCGFRPECVDALYKIDTHWNIPQGRLVTLPPKKEFIVTCNGSFFRPEVTHYLREVLPRYKPTKKKVVLVPCAADKPYPSPLHKEVLKRMPEDYYLAIHTGVLGIVPQDLWDEMPHYDSGLPYEWRLMNMTRHYFRTYQHEHVVVYADFYSLALQYGLGLAHYNVSGDKEDQLYAGEVTFVNPVQHYCDYLDLLMPERLANLERAFQRQEVMG